MGWETVLCLIIWRSSSPEGVGEFKRMVEKHQIHIPTNVCAGLSDKDFDSIIAVALGLVTSLGKCTWKRLEESYHLQQVEKDV